MKDVVRKQVDMGVDVLNDGEVSQPSYALWAPTSR
jgi:hypothetical protein